MQARVIPALLIGAGLIWSVGACSSGQDSPLPGTSGVVNPDAPLTAEQAQRVGHDGHSLMVGLLDDLNVAELDGVVAEDSREEWTECTAAQKSFSFEPSYNGVMYRATVSIASDTPRDDADVRAQLMGSDIEWQQDDSNIGASGIYQVRIVRTDPLRIQVSSPCYFIESSREGEIPTTEDITSITGYRQQAWQS